MKFFAQFVCGKEVEDIICTNVVFLLCGYDYAQLNRVSITEEMRLIRYLFHGSWFIFFSVFSAARVCLQMLSFTLPLSLLVLLYVYTR